MTPETDVHEAISNLRVKVAEHEGTLRAVKHDVANIQQAQGLIAAKLDRMEDRFGGKIDEIKKDVSAKVDELKAGLVGVTIKQERGLGYIAGVVSVFTIGGGLLLGFIKLLFPAVGGH